MILRHGPWRYPILMNFFSFHHQRSVKHVLCNYGMRTEEILEPANDVRAREHRSQGWDLLHSTEGYQVQRDAIRT